MSLISEYDAVDASGNKSSAFGAATTPFTASTKYDIQPGDIVRYLQDKGTGFVTKVSLAYSPTMSNPYTGAQGWLVGARDKYYVTENNVDIQAGTHKVLEVSNAGDTLTIGNPYALEGETLRNTAHRYHMYDVRTIYGTVFKKNNGFITLTTQDLRIPGSVYLKNGIPPIVDDGGSPGFFGVYLTDSFEISRFRTSVIEYHDKNVVKVRAGTADDINDYLDSGNNCSEVIVTTRSGEPQELCIINDYRSGLIP